MVLIVELYDNTTRLLNRNSNKTYNVSKVVSGSEYNVRAIGSVQIFTYFTNENYSLCAKSKGWQKYMKTQVYVIN